VTEQTMTREERLEMIRSRNGVVRSPAVTWLLSEIDRLDAEAARLRAVAEAARASRMADREHSGLPEGERWLMHNLEKVAVAYKALDVALGLPPWDYANGKPRAALAPQEEEVTAA